MPSQKRPELAIPGVHSLDSLAFPSLASSSWVAEAEQVSIL